MSERKTPEFQPTIAAPRSGPATSTGEPASSLAQKLIAGRYEIVSLIGGGGMGTVYRALDTELDEQVALKVLRRELVETPGMLDRFRREVKLARRVTHKNVARAFDIGEHEGEKFLTMELVEGEPLSALVTRERRLSARRIIEIAIAICEGLDAAHAAGVVHRDLKPDNVLVTKDGRVVITDFGIARSYEPGASTRTQGLPIGTPAYMAPEQVEGADAIDGRTDLYALGVMLFELFTGAAPWRGDSPYGVAAVRLVTPPPDPRTIVPALAPQVAELVLRAMARKLEDRFPNARSLADALAKLPTDDAPPPPMAIAPTLTPDALRAADERNDKTVAVLPFRNGGPPDDEYLADGLTEDLIDQLSMTKGLRVRPRGSVIHLRGREGDVRAIGAELGVSVIVEGSVRRSGAMLRVTTRVSSVADGFQLWAKRFDRPASDLLAVSDEVTGAVAAALTIEHQAKTRKSPTDPEALDLYLRARHDYHRWELAAVLRAVETLQRALTLAPDEPMILTTYALARVRLWFFGVEGSGVAAKEAVEHAERVAPARPETKLARAAVLFHEGDVEGAVRGARAALLENPAFADAHELLGRIFTETGPVDRGIHHSTMAARLDPGLRTAASQVARIDALFGRWQAFNEYVESVRDEALAPWAQIVRIVGWRGDREMLSRVSEMTGLREQPLARAVLAFIQDRSREVSSAISLPTTLNDPRASWRGRAFSGQASTEIAMGRGRTDEAITLLAAAVEAGLIDLLWFDHCPVLDPLRELPRFSELRKTVADRAARIRAAAGVEPSDP